MIEEPLDRAEDPMTLPFRIETDSLGGIEAVSYTHLTLPTTPYV